VELAVVNPLYVLGPTIASAELNSSLENVKKILMGDTSHLPLNGCIGVVDVRDVALAHVLAATTVSANNQRLFCVNRVIAWAEIAATLKRLFPQYPVVNHPDILKPTFSIDNQPLANLGLSKYIDVDQMLKEMVQSLQKNKAVPML